MRIFGIVALLVLATGCATTRVVHLDTGKGAPIVYTPVESEPVEISEEEFKNAVTQLLIDMELNVALNEAERGDSPSLLASVGGIVDDAQSRTVPPLYERVCQRQSDPGDCLSLLADRFTLGPMERRMMALYFALDTVWEGIEEAIKDLTNPAALRAMISTMIGTALVMLVAPEPVTKFIALALTASLIAYLGTGPVWKMGQGFLRLMDESSAATKFSELEDAGHRFGRILGDNGARVLAVVALAALGGKNAMAAQGPKLPGATQAALRAQAEGGFQFSAVLGGEVQAISVSSAEVLRSRAGMSFSFGETNRPESNPYPENLFLRGSLTSRSRRQRLQRWLWALEARCRATPRGLSTTFARTRTRFPKLRVGLGRLFLSHTLSAPE